VNFFVATDFRDGSKADLALSSMNVGSGPQSGRLVRQSKVVERRILQVCLPAESGLGSERGTRPLCAKPGHQVAAGQSFNCYQGMAIIEGILKFGEAEWNIGDDFSSMGLPCS
jgi:hypothetical protein